MSDTAQSHSRQRIEELAAEAGFDVAGITSPAAMPEKTGDWLTAFIEKGWHGDMEWMASTAARRRHPSFMWPEARSMILLGLNYGPETDPLEALNDKSSGILSCYAKGKDYHGLIKKKLKRMAGRFHQETGADVKVFVDTAPLMEKPAAAAAGLGWQGKHSNLVSRDFGSWLFLGAILTTAQLEIDKSEEDHCGSCRACLDICPTKAFPAPYQLDARRCISYLTIEHKGHIAAEFRPLMGNRIFGCDDCLAICPWNKYARAARERRLLARAETDNPPLRDLLTLDDKAFRSRFAGTPVKRTGRDRFLRNVLIAAGNSDDRALLPAILPLLQDLSPLVRAMAVWASRRLSSANEFAILHERHAAAETDCNVRSEWHTGLDS